MFRKKTRGDAPTLWIATSDLPTTPSHSSYQRPDQVLVACGFGDEVRELAAPHYTRDVSKGGRPGIDPEV